MAQIIHDDSGRPEQFFATAIAALDHFQHGVIRLAGVMLHGHGLVPVRIKYPARSLHILDPVAPEQAAQLLQRHLHALPQRLGGSGWFTGQRPLEIIEYRQHVLDERFLLRLRFLLRIAPGSLFEIVEVGRQAQIRILLPGNLLAQRDDRVTPWKIPGRSFSHLRIGHFVFGFGACMRSHTGLPTVSCRAISGGGTWYSGDAMIASFVSFTNTFESS